MSGEITMEKVHAHIPQVLNWLRRGWIWLAALAGSMLLFGHFFTIGVNASESLKDYSLFLVIKGDKNIARNDLVAFEYVGTNPYDPRLRWVKRAAGVAGDVVTVEGRKFFVNGKEMGTAKEYGKRGALKGKTLELGPTGVIPEGHIYVQADHPDSLDSRYALMGWVAEERIIGRAVVIF